ncbi:hypothetical protein ACFE04_017681 [Oxalis oulophora]
MIVLGLAFAAGFVVWAYQALKPPPTKICGTPDGPPVTSPRIKLSDGRHLSYRETGVPKQDAKYKIIVIHGFDSSKDLNLPVSQELIEELGIYFLFFDRAGYGESDPYSSRSVKSEAYDIQELADKLQIGGKFYVMGLSIGAYPVFGCLKYIPNRLSGAALIVPFVHYWWPSLPTNLSQQALNKLLPGDRFSFRIAHYTPWLYPWWMSQKWFPSLSIMAGNMAIFSPQDMEMVAKMSQLPSVGQEKVRQQGVHESLYRDLISGFAKWEFDPTDLSNPFPENEGLVHIWQGVEDRVIPLEINRFVAEKLPWIKYHEVPNAGHLLIFDPKLCEAVLRELVG